MKYSRSKCRYKLPRDVLFLVGFTHKLYSYERTQLKNERFEVESVISVGDCDQTEILVTGFETSTGPHGLPGPDELSNPVTSISVWSQSPTEITLSTSKRSFFSWVYS